MSEITELLDWVFELAGTLSGPELVVGIVVVGVVILVKYSGVTDKDEV